MILQFIGVVLTSVCALYFYKYIHRMQYDLHDVILKHYPGPCKQLLDVDGGGAEDLTTLPDGLTFISTGFLVKSKRKILLFDFNDPKEKLIELKIDPKIPDFHPHGIAVWTEPNSDVITLFAVNHGGRESVEVLEFRRGTATLNLIKTILTQGRPFNDIVAVSKDKFYGTQYMEFANNKFLSLVEMYSMIDLGKVWFYDGNDFKLVESGLAFPNGINTSPDLKYIYVIEFWNKQINAYRRNNDNSLQLINRIYMDTGCDNIEVEPNTGDLWIGCHMRIHQIHTYGNNMGKTLSPSQVLKIKTQNGNLTTDITEIFVDDGQFCSGASTASYFKGRMLLGTVGTQLILCDVLNS